MNQNACCDWLPEPGLPVVSHKKKILCWPKFSVKMARYWPRSFFCEFMDLRVLVHKHPKKEFGQYPAISTSRWANNPFFDYMVNSASGQDEPNRALRLATRAWSHLARSELPAVFRKQNFTKSHIINPLLTKFVRSVHKHGKKELGQYPAIFDLTLGQ